jgi:SAM-dependent methyltransferase
MLASVGRTSTCFHTPRPPFEYERGSRVEYDLLIRRLPTPRLSTLDLSPMPNLWQILYSDPISPEQTARECAFIAGVVPLETHPRLLDLACETGRHSLSIASLGYTVTGVDIDPRVLQVARDRAVELGVEVELVEADLHDLRGLAEPFDAIILFWQSFGFFSNEAQSGLFTEIHRLLRTDGVLILDVFNRLHYTRGGGNVTQFAAGAPTRTSAWSETERITEMLGYEEDRSMDERRMVDLLDPHLFTLGEIAGIAHNHGLQLVLSCSGYDPKIAATAEHPKMQLVFRRS